MKKGLKQLNTIQRTKLQTLLKVKKSLQEISDELGVSRQTLYREKIIIFWIIFHLNNKIYFVN